MDSNPRTDCRRADGSIDYDFYRARAATLRTEAIRGAVRAAFAWLGRRRPVVSPEVVAAALAVALTLPRK
ncbi:MAG: hypothetical protein EXQ95_10160 [Alphaproteobacteria bacterium]|nr:hypothetical protein [Alphaproteobacteria bacterium]